MNLISTIQLSAEDVATALANHIKAAYPQVQPEVLVTTVEGTTGQYSITASISQAPAAPAKAKGKRGGRPRKNAVTEVAQSVDTTAVLTDPDSPVSSPYLDQVADEAPAEVEVEVETASVFADAPADVSFID